MTGWPYKSKNFTFDKKNNRQLTKKCPKRQIALNYYNVLFFDIFLKSENIIWESAIYK